MVAAVHFNWKHGMIGRWKKNSVTDNHMAAIRERTKAAHTAQRSYRETAAITTAWVSLGLIVVCLYCVYSLTEWYEKIRYKRENKLNSKSQPVIINIEYEETKDE